MILLYELNTSIDLDRVNTSIEMILKDLDFLIFYIFNETITTSKSPEYRFEDEFKGLYGLYISYMLKNESIISSNSKFFKEPFFDFRNKCAVYE